MNQNSILIDCHQDIAYSVRANRRLFEENIDNLMSIDMVIKSENLIDELYNVLKTNKCNHSALQSLDYFNNFIDNLNIKKNKSNHKDYREYYTKELADMVIEKDRIIIASHSYSS